MRRNNVDLPEPDRPSRPTICPARSSRFMPSNTNSSAPSGFGNALRTSVHCSNGASFMSKTLSGKSIFALGVVIQGTPEQPIDDDDEQAHGAYPQDDAVKISGRGCLRDVGAQSSRLDLRIPPGGQFGDYRGIPRAAGSGDGAGHIERQNRRQGNLTPPQPTRDSKIRRRVAHLRGYGGCAGDDVEENVPLSAQNHQWAQPNVRIQFPSDDFKHRDGKQ